MAMRILSIETSCDETSLALVEAKGGINKPKFKVLKNIVSSQIKVHQPFGGVVPNLAKREHLKNLPKILKKLQATRQRRGSPRAASYKLQDIDAIAVTVGPGLEPALWAGVVFAQDLSKKLKKPLIGANHMEGHLYSPWLVNKKEVQFPAIALVVSGGHTILLAMESLTKWTKLGETRDDAAGEAFDKVARLLKLPYPGGPEIEKLAKKGNSEAIAFPRPMLKDKNYEFSFSGLKTSVLYYLRDNPKTKKADAAASFQQAVLDVLIGKTMRAVKEYRAKSVILSGGVAANKTLREALGKRVTKEKAKFFVPDFEFNTDNAAMIAAAAYIQTLKKKKLPIKANSNLNL